jgi:L-prolyl-PCP dehydrogenase
MNFELSPEQILMQESIFRTANNLKLKQPFSESWNEIAATGIIGTCIDKTYGGSGLGALDMVLALESLAEGNSDNGLSFAIAAHTLSCVIPINKFGSTAQKESLLPQLISGTTIAANAMTESESGSDVFNMQCKAILKNGTYHLNGTKTFISNSSPSSLLLTYAITNAEKKFFGGITAFIVNKGNYIIGTEFKKMGLENCSLGEIIFDDTKLNKDSILGKEGGGAFIFTKSMEWERICLTGIHLGAMKRVLKKTIEFVNQRKSNGKSISSFQGISHSLAEMKVALEVSRSYAYKAAWSLDHKINVRENASIAKLFVSTSTRDFMLKAMQVFGGYGYITDYGIEQEVRDALASTIYSGTSEIQKNIIVSHLDI